MPRLMRLTGLGLLLTLLGFAALATGCAPAPATATPVPSGRPTFIFFYTDA